MRATLVPGVALRSPRAPPCALPAISSSLIKQTVGDRLTDVCPGEPDRSRLENYLSRLKPTARLLHSTAPSSDMAPTLSPTSPTRRRPAPRSTVFRSSPGNSVDGDLVNAKGTSAPVCDELSRPHSRHVCVRSGIRQSGHLQRPAPDHAARKHLTAAAEAMHPSRLLSASDESWLTAREKGACGDWSRPALSLARTHSYLFDIQGQYNLRKPSGPDRK